MKNRIILFFAFFFLCFIQLKSQDVVQGYVLDASSREKLIGCDICILNTTDGVASNNYGFFSLKVANFPSTLVFKYVGYLSDTVVVYADMQNIEVLMKPQIMELRGAVVTANRVQINSQRVGVLRVPMKQISLIPTLGGEVDVMKAFQLLPGVQSGVEGTSGLYVRGGTPDQNLIQIDDVPLYYVNHIGGFISVFDANAINDITLVKGGFPARYGGRLSSVIDIRMKTGNSEKIKSEVGVGLLATRFFTEGPLNTKTRFMFSIRRCNLDLATRIFGNLSGKKYSAGYTFYDLYSKFTHVLDNKNSLSVSVYNGRDRIFFNQKETQLSYIDNYSKSKSNVKWGNILVSAKWNRQYTPNIFGSTTFAYTLFNYINGSDYKLKDANKNIIESKSSSFISSVNDLILKKEVDFFISNNTKLNAGASFINHAFSPGLNILKNVDNDTVFGSTKVFSNEIMLYADSEIKFSKHWSGNMGLHFNTYWVKKSSFSSLQPRLTLCYTPLNSVSLKASYTYMQQNMHLLSNNNAGLPTDLWVPATSKTLPLYSNMLSLGVLLDVEKYSTAVTIEGYYKDFINLIEFKEGASFFNGTNQWEDKIERNGKGRSFGMECLIQQKLGMITGWVAYTLSYNFRNFKNINHGEWFPYKFDRRHNVSVFASYQINDNIILSSNFVFNTGNAITLPNGVYPTINESFVDSYFSDNPVVAINQTYANTYTYDGRNQERMPNYHRLDISARFIKPKKTGKREWVISIYNVYSKLNPYFVYINTDNEKKLHLYKVSLFPIIPSISYIRSF
ncbi:MAG: TonB-dependent receptor [Bacteroidales bacterium]|jgi:hypothetical protein